MENYKHNFSITNIGSFRFYSGIIVGLAYSVLFNLLLQLCLRIANLGVNIDEWSLDYTISPYYHILLAFSAICFAFSFTTNLWMSVPFPKNKRTKLHFRMAQTNTLWGLFCVLLFLLRMLYFLMGTDLTIEHDFPVTGFLLPLFLYLYCWQLISRVYCSRKAFLITSGGILIICTLLAMLT